MSDTISYNQKQDIVVHLVEALTSDPDHPYPSDTVSEVVDSWLPIYYNQIREEWVDAGCPDPDEFMPENDDNNQLNIHSLMVLGLCELALHFAHSAIWGSSGNGPDTNAEALENLTENYPDLVYGLVT